MAKKVFISGASGLVGSNCLSYFKEQGWEVLGSHLTFPTSQTVYYNTLDHNHRDNFDIEAFNPDILIHSGALTNVDYCEANEQESFNKTVASTQNIMKVAKACNAVLVYLSTDYVFDGKDGPYSEDSPTNPLNIYGKHKLMAEDLVRGNSIQHLILRVTNVYGNELRNKNFVARIVEQCKQKQKIQLSLPYDQYATPINALDIAKAMFLLLQDGKHGLYHLSSTDYMNRVELAQKVLAYFPDVEHEIITSDTQSLSQTALRPLLGGLRHHKFSALYPQFIFSNIDDYLSGHKDA